MAITLCAKKTEITERLFLLNPSTGRTLHSLFQPVIPLPDFLGAFVSKVVFLARLLLRPVCKTSIWPYLKAIVHTTGFFCVFIVTAFLGGFPPEQPAFFTCYCEDIFLSRAHTMHLLDLIVSLDEECPFQKLANHSYRTTIVSGWPDIMTGVYHSNTLARVVKGAKHVMFTMGSHFLLIEWPAEVAAEILELLGEEVESSQPTLSCVNEAKTKAKSS